MEQLILPVTIQGPLRILPVWLSTLITVLCAAAALYIFLKYILPLFLQKNNSGSDNQYAPASNRDTISEDISKIKRKGIDTGNYRGALFALSRYMKMLLAKNSGIPFMEMTAYDIREKCSSKVHTGFFTELEKTIYGSNAVTRKTMNDMCRSASAAARRKVQEK